MNKQAIIYFSFIYYLRPNAGPLPPTVDQCRLSWLYVGQVNLFRFLGEDCQGNQLCIIPTFVFKGLGIAEEPSHLSDLPVICSYFLLQSFIFARIGHRTNDLRIGVGIDYYKSEHLSIYPRTSLSIGCKLHRLTFNI